MKSLLGLVLIAGVALTVFANVENNSSDERVQDNIFAAIRSIDYISINLLLAEGTNIDTADSKGNTPLMVAAEVGNPRILEIILSHNPAINKQNNEGVTALMIASQTGQLHIVKKLVDRHADITVRDSQGNPAIQLASKFGQKQIVSFLQDAQKPGELAM